MVAEIGFWYLIVISSKLFNARRSVADRQWQGRGERAESLMRERPDGYGRRRESGQRGESASTCSVAGGERAEGAWEKEEEPERGLAGSQRQRPMREGQRSRGVRKCAKTQNVATV